MPRKGEFGYTPRDCQKIAKARGGEFLSKFFHGMRVKYPWRCSEGHEWQESLRYVLDERRRKEWCPHCAKASRDAVWLGRMNKSAKKEGGKCLATQFDGLRANYRWECRHGHQWENSAFGIIYNKSWCPECHRNKELKLPPASMPPPKVAVIKRGKSPMKKASYIKGERRWKHGDVHPETGKYFWAYERRRWVAGGEEKETTDERWLTKESFEHRRARKLLRQRKSKTDHRPPPHLRFRKHGDIHPKNGLVFWAYERTHKGGERWVTKEYFEKAKEKTARYRKMEHRHITRRKYERIRIKTDPVFRLRVRIRAQIRAGLRNYVSDYGRTMLEKTLGCSVEELRIHLEKQFQPGMSWKNHGRGDNCWHIDHIIPVASAKTREDVFRLCHFSNLRPLWGVENLSKGATAPDGTSYRLKPYGTAWRRKFMPLPPRAKRRSPATPS